ncbi:DUF5069 domain-containing protein [Oleiharenicola lentus]|uniref:DUF5069 domain-containing protein n=1 Tax=Oleiharenicola lentus TaxID=2508720 RepID=UPI003F673410
MISYSTPDLTQHPPRSPRFRLGGYVVLPRIFDKARAQLAGKTGLYKYNNPLDQRLFSFLGITGEQFLEAAKTCQSDTQILDWVTANAQPKRQTWEIAAWTHWLETLPPGDAKRHTTFAKEIEANCPTREDIRTLFDRLDMDDHVTFGGKA